MKYFVTLSVPVEAENAQDALDFGWERIIDPEGPPEGLLEHVGITELLSVDGVPASMATTPRAERAEDAA